MINSAINCDIRATKNENIIILMSTEGDTASGFVGEVLGSLFKHVKKQDSLSAGLKLGDVLSKKHDGKDIFAIVCYSQKNWDNADIIVQNALHALEIKKPAAFLAVGLNFIDMQHIPIIKIKNKLESSDKIIDYYYY